MKQFSNYARVQYFPTCHETRMLTVRYFYINMYTLFTIADRLLHCRIRIVPFVSLASILNFELNHQPSEAYSEPYQTSKMERLAKIVKDFQVLTIFSKFSILDICQGSEYASGLIGSIYSWYEMCSLRSKQLQNTGTH